MLVALEIYFDTESEARVLSISRALHASARPHVSLVVGNDPLLDLRDDLSILLRGPQLNLTFGSVGSFSGGLLFLGTTPTTQLLTLQQKAYDLAVNGGVEVVRHCEPSQWTPHCTIARLPNARETSAAMKIAQKHLPITAEIERIGLTRVGTGKTEVISG